MRIPRCSPAAQVGKVMAHLVLGVTLASCPAGAQDRSQPASSTEPVSTSGEYRIGPGDMISVGVTGLKAIQQSTRVSNSGKIRVPHLGIVKVAGMTATQLQDEVARLLRERGLVNAPQVNVRIDQYRAQPVYILGEVMAPGQFVIKDEMYLTELLALAAGFNEVASPIGYLYRRKENTGDLGPGEAPTDEAIPIDFQALNEGRAPELNLKLRGGDVLYVPQRRKEYYFVVGDVNNPGVFEIKVESRGILLTRALAQAGGPTKTARMSGGILVRFDQEGAREELRVDFKAILDGRQPDLLVKSNDIIFIPGSNAKTLGYGLLGIIPTLASQGVTAAQ